MSPELRAAIEARIGPGRPPVEVGRGHGGTRVFRADGVWIKAHASARKHRQEVRAYLEVVPRLAAVGFRVPALLDRDDAHRLLFLSHVEGEAVRADRPDLHRQAGELVAALRGLPCEDRDPLPLPVALSRRMERAVARATPWLPAATLRRAEAAVDGFRAFEGVARRWCHRDLTPENWLVHEGRLGLVDFEHTRPDAPTVDLVRLAEAHWSRDPRTRDAFLRGHGPLDDAETERLDALSWLHGVATVAWAEAHGDAAFAARGRRLLERLEARAPR